MECNLNQQCQFLYTCVEGICRHQPLLPPTTYTFFVYLMIPFLVAIANVAGVSAGFLKILLFMDFLNYSITQATINVYPIILGGGLANFFLLIKKKHPYKQGPCVNYNVANVVIPGLVIGTTFGSLTNALIPEFILDLISMLICIVLLTLFGFRVKDYFAQKKFTEGHYKKMLPDRVKSPNKKIQGTLELVNIQEDDGQISQSTPSSQKPTVKKAIREEAIKQQTINYPIWEILFTLIFFSIVEVSSLALQGKIIYFNVCEGLGGLGFPLLFVLLILIELIYFYGNLKPKYTRYEQFRLQSDIDLSVGKTICIICVGSFVGGFSTGLIALGCGHVVILTLLHLNVPQQIASATAGYQVVFIGLTSTIEAIVYGYLSWFDLLFLGLLSFVGSFFLTILLNHLLEKFDDKGVCFILFALILLLSLSLVGVIVSLALTLNSLGFDKMMIPAGLDCQK